MALQTSTNRLRQVSEITEDILLNANITNAPVDIQAIAEQCNITIEEADLGDDISGVLVIHNDKAVIACNTNQGLQRKRFTIAHELGHFALHRNKKKDTVFVDKDFIIKKYRSNKSYTEVELKQEQEANAFAASLLMPKNFVFEEICKEQVRNLPESELIAALAEVFNVSLPAMTFRLANLNILY